MFKLSDEVYNYAKWITMIGLPSLTVFYVALASIWALPFADEVAKTSAAVVALLSAWLQISTNVWKNSQPKG